MTFLQTNAKVNQINDLTQNSTGTYSDSFDDIAFRDAVSNVWGWGDGTLTNQRDISWSPLDFYPTQNSIRDLEIQGRKVYAVGYNESTFTRSLLALDITDPSNIFLTSYRNSIYSAISCAIDGDVFYVGSIASGPSGLNRLHVYNVSKPYSLGGGSVYESFHSTSGGVTDIDAEGYRIYYISYNDTNGDALRIANTRNPDAITTYTPNWNNKKALGLEVSGHIAYIAASDEGLYTLNISNKYTPTELDFIPLPGNATDVILDGQIAFVSLGYGGVASIDISNPNNIQQLSAHNGPGIYSEMVLQGNTLYVAGGPSGVLIYDVADPMHLTLVDSIPVPYAWDVELFGGTLVVGSKEGIHTFAVEAASGGLTDISAYVFPNHFYDYQVWDIEVIGDIAYIAGGPDGLYTLDIRDPNDPVLLDRWTNGNDNFYKLSINGQFAHCANASGEYIFDIANPLSIRFLNSLSGTSMYEVENIGGFSHVALGDGTSVYGIGNTTLPMHPTILASYSGGGVNYTSVAVQGRHAFLGVDAGGSGSDGVQAFDIRGFPYQTDAKSIASQIWDLYVEGDILYSANGNWLDIWNVSRPYFLVYEDWINWGQSNVMKGVHPFGTTLVAAKNMLGVSLVNVSDVTNINNFSNYYDATAATQVEVAGDYIYVANQSSLIIFRLFKSAADTYLDSAALAQSTSIYGIDRGSISSATLDIEAYHPEMITFEMSSDGGVTWQAITPGVSTTFTTPGKDLRWRAIFDGAKHISPHLYSIEINYETKSGFVQFLGDYMWYLIGGGAGLILVIVIIAVVVRASKKKKMPTR
jgi:hypothetical protein